MALARVKNWVVETLTASDLNAEFNNILSNALTLISPLTAALDFDGKELILDADADTSITADTDDQIDIRIAGADDFQFTANTFTALTGSIIAIPLGLVGTPTLTFTGDLNTGIFSPGAEQVAITTAGVSRLHIAAAGLIGINETVNANMTIGLTINQGANDNNILELKSSDVDHGGVGAGGVAMEADSFTAFRKISVDGGLIIVCIQDSTTDDTAAILVGSTVDADVDAVDTSTNTTIQMKVEQHDSAGTRASMEAGANVFSVVARVAGASRTIFVVDEDGDLFADAGTSTTAVTVFDKENDAEVCRALDLLSTDAIQGKWDKFVQYNEQSLINMEILGGPVTYPNPNGSTGLVNITKLQKLHNGAIWQLYTKYMDSQQRIEQLENKLTQITGMV